MTRAQTIKPAYVTFTGVDRIEILPKLKKLSAKYPIEWGVLIDPAQEDSILFPTKGERKEIQSSGLRLSAHICGVPAAEIANGIRPTHLKLDGFSRLQINHSRDGSTEENIKNAHQFAISMGMRPALQCQGDFPSELRADWLYDVSFGLGTRPTEWPVLNSAGTFCGYSGGISPETVEATIKALPLSDSDTGNFWIDMESGVRTGGLLDVEKCEQVCKAIFGY